MADPSSGRASASSSTATSWTDRSCRSPTRCEYRFQVQSNGKIVHAEYTGIVPDGFKSGSEVVLKGRLNQQTGSAWSPNGVMAKCPSKYDQPEPPRAGGIEELTSAMPTLGTFLLLASFVVAAYAIAASRGRRAPAFPPAGGKRHRRVLPRRRADDGRVGGDRPRLRHGQLRHQVRPALFGRGAAAGLQDRVVLGRARRLDHVLGVPAGVFGIDRRLREPRAAPRADPLGRRDHRRHGDVLHLPDGRAQQPVLDVPRGAAGRREGAEPAAPELLHGDPSAVALHRASWR